MTSDVVFMDEQFSFRQGDIVYVVRTEVGEGPARVVVDQVGEQEQAMEPEES